MTADPHLTPDDGAVACRSFPRRFRQTLDAAHEEHGVPVDELLDQDGADGHASPRTSVTAAVAVLLVLDQALADAAHDPPRALGPQTAELASITGSAASETAEELLAQVETTAQRCAERIERTPTSAWTARLTIAGSTDRPTAIGLVREAVGVVARHLRDLEQGLGVRS